jgi:hypothetical protein
MASTTNNIDADEYSEEQQHVEPGQGSSNSKKAKTWRMQNFSDSWPGQKQNCKIVYFLLVCYITAICVQAQTANIFARLFTFETGRLPLETEMFHRSCDVSH